jgi:hypothetical protein
MVFRSGIVRNAVWSMPLLIKLNPKTDHNDFQHNAELSKISKSL